MVKAVLTTKVDPTYDDLPEQRYHFPRTYLRQIEAAVGNWIVYYEPRRSSGDLSSRGGRQAYFATARLTHVEPDPAMPDHFYAFVADYLDFDRAVPFKDGDFYYESGLRKADASTNRGAFGRAVREIPDAEYDLILSAAYKHVLEVSVSRSNAGANIDYTPSNAGFADEGQAAFEAPTQPRRLVTHVLERPFRDRAFSLAIKSAYRDTCAMTGLKIVNGGGRTEVQAAHIRPVADDGPDSVRNGIALCGTLHWMFDRGLVSIDDDYSLLLAGSSVPDTVLRLLNEDGRLSVPISAHERPHQQFLQYHRDMVFKG